jgi:ubiquinone/menaquinone biosynthesis C-methylase UbiE
MPEPNKNPIVFSGIIAENYEKHLSPVLFIPTAADIASRLPANSENILEIACGTGQVTRLLKEKFSNAKITATDINPDMLSVAKNVVGEGGNVEWKVMDAQELDFPDNTFDCVICQFGIMFFPDKQKAVNEAYRVLKPGGKYIFNTWDSMDNLPVSKLSNDTVVSFFKDDPPQFFKIPFSMYEPAEMETLLKNAGFKNISVTNIKLEGSSPTAADAARGFTMGNPTYLAICERDESMLPDIRTAVEKKFTEKFGAENLRIPLSLYVSEGVK